MSVKNIYTILIILITIFNFSVSNAQQFIGISGGYGKGTFFDLAGNQDYHSKYHFHNGGGFSSFYETKMDSTRCRIELQYRFQSADLEVYHNAGHASFYRNLNYSFQLLNLNLIYPIQLIEKKSWKMYFTLGPTLSYNTNTIAIGNGWDYMVKNRIDTTGNTIYYPTIHKWEKNESKSKDLSRFNLGFDAGLEFIIPVYNKLGLIIQNRYNIFITSANAREKFKYTSLLTGYVNFGLRYSLKKNDL